MPEYIENIETLSLPLVVLRGAVAFPGMTLNSDVADDVYRSPAAVKAAAAEDRQIFLAPLLDPSEPDGDEPDAAKLCRVGTVARIKQLIRTPDGDMRLIAEGQCRATLTSLSPPAAYLTAEVEARTVRTAEEDEQGDDPRNDAYLREANKALRAIVRFIPAIADDIMRHVSSIRNIGLYADFVAANILMRYDDKLRVLERFEPEKRMETLIRVMNQEGAILTCEKDIQRRVRERIDRQQREYFLREEIKVIQDELGDMDDVDEFDARIEAARLPKDVEAKLLKENDRLSKLPFGSAEAAVLANYLDTCLDLPWNYATRDRVDIEATRRVLDRDHDGLEKVKERILEFMAVRQLTPELGNQILCLVGPPGVGKTSIAASVASAMKRRYVRVSLGGVRDEADIRGHRKTYIGAMPGRIIAALLQARARNPLILLDEIDKLTNDAHGDPASALLEVLDPDQNSAFRDHFIEMPFDLSDCLFIATANTLDTVPKTLVDRMEVIELPSYTRNEKIAIALHHLVPKQLKKHGLNRRALRITEAAIGELIDSYTLEAGVRNLERAIAALCRKAAKQLLENADLRRVVVDAADVKGYLGARKFLPERISGEDETGVVNGLAYTETGGDLLRVEVAVLDGTGKLELTGSLGDVMKESARTALTYTRSVAARFGIPADFYSKRDIHIHVPEGAVPKDGPSAGVTMMTALVSALSGIPVRRDVAMTGEITLRGRVLPVGGLKEKTTAAYAAGVRTVLLPADNLGDLDEIDPEARAALTFVPCRTAAEVLDAALTDGPARRTSAGIPRTRERPAMTGLPVPILPDLTVPPILPPPTAGGPSAPGAP